MNNNPTILINISRTGGWEAADCRQIAHALAENGADCIIASDLYHIPKGDSKTEQITSIEGAVVVLSDYYPRAVFWVLREMGLDKQYAADLSALDSNSMVCFRLQDKCCPDKWVECISGSISDTGEKGNITEISSGDSERWYPVLDYSRCSSCGACHEFCIFGVYERCEGDVTVADPGKCKPGCPACARTCPEQALMFPLDKDPGIAGKDGAEIKPFNSGDVERARERYRQGNLDISKVIQACSSECGCDCSDGECEDEHCDTCTDCSCGPEDDKAYFDRIIDGLENT